MTTPIAVLTCRKNPIEKMISVNILKFNEFDVKCPDATQSREQTGTRVIQVKVNIPRDT